MSLSLQTNITLEQLYSLLHQLSPDEKIAIAKKLRADALIERWKAIGQDLPDEPEISMEEIVNEVKIVRKEMYDNNK
jgi:hypothetical protein